MRLLTAMIASITILMSSVALADDGPFGIYQGEKLSELKDVKVITDSLYFVSPPKPHPDFKSYVVFLVSNMGVCKVVATTEPNDNDDYGLQTKQKFDDLKAQLEQKYGESKTNNFLLPGSIFTDAKYWSLALQKQQRVLSAYWIAGGRVKLPDNLVGITLKAADNGSGPNLQLHYDFANGDKCRDELKKKAAGSL